MRTRLQLISCVRQAIRCGFDFNIVHWLSVSWDDRAPVTASATLESLFHHFPNSIIWCRDKGRISSYPFNFSQSIWLPRWVKKVPWQTPWSLLPFQFEFLSHMLLRNSSERLILKHKAEGFFLNNIKNCIDYGSYQCYITVSVR